MQRSASSASRLSDTHHLAFFWLLCLYTHAWGCFVRGSLPGQPVQCLGYYSWTWTVWAGVVYFLERMLRVVRSYRATQVVGVVCHPSNVIELRFEKPSFKYRAGQWLFLNVPEVARFQWHPFTISSAPDDPFVSVHIRQVGDFTQALGTRLGCTEDVRRSLTSNPFADEKALDSKSGDGFSTVSLDSIVNDRPFPRICVDGPFGAPAEDVFNYEVAILVGAGIGVTPFASILKNIKYQQEKGRLRKLKRVVFVWINRDIGSFEWFHALLSELEESQADPYFLQINTFLTQRIDMDMMHNIIVNDVGTEFDPLTKLRSRTQFGRPNFVEIFSGVRRAIESGMYVAGLDASTPTNVGVFYCGPGPLAKNIKEKARVASTSVVRFKFFKEHF